MKFQSLWHMWFSNESQPFPEPTNDLFLKKRIWPCLCIVAPPIIREIKKKPMDNLWPNSGSPHWCEHNMFLRFDFVLLAIIIFATGISSLLLHGMHGEVSLWVCVIWSTGRRRARMMVRSGAALMRGNGRNDGKQSGREKFFWFLLGVWWVVV